MHQVSFGDALKETRLARGLDIAQVSRDLRIRQDIIVAIETSDFARMPSRGYTRNMVIAYARLLGLDAQEMSRMYLDQEYAYQIERAHRSVDNNVRMHQTGRTARTGSMGRVGSGRAASYEEPESVKGQYDGSSNGFGRRVYSQNADIGPTYSPQTAHKARRSAITDGKYTNLYSAPRNIPNPNAGRNRVIAIVAVIAIAVAIIAALFLTHRSEPQATIPITGAESQQSTQDQSSDQTQEATQTETTTSASAPTEITFTYTVASGKESYIEVYVDDATKESHTVKGPATQTYTSTGKIRFVSSETSGITATLNGEEVELTTGSSGIVNQTFTLDEAVKAWNEANASSSSSSGSTSASSSGSSSSKSSSSSSSSRSSSTS